MGDSQRSIVASGLCLNPPPPGASCEALIRLGEARAKAELRRSVLEPESGVAVLGFRSTLLAFGCLRW